MAPRASRSDGGSCPITRAISTSISSRSGCASRALTDPLTRPSKFPLLIASVRFSVGLLISGLKVRVLRGVFSQAQVLRGIVSFLHYSIGTPNTGRLPSATRWTIASHTPGGATRNAPAGWLPPRTERRVAADASARDGSRASSEASWIASFASRYRVLASARPISFRRTSSA